VSYWEAFLLAVVEGLTEFLPVSSTGHLVIASAVMGLKSTEFLKSFTIVVQFGTILSVLVIYWRRFLKGDFYFYRNLFLSFLPAAVVGLLFAKKIDELLESVTSVAWALILGGVGLILLDRWQRSQAGKAENSTQISEAAVEPTVKDPVTAIKIGLWQCLALFPGVSRSGATIAGGLLSGLSQRAAAEYSFFLAVPTLTAASAYKTLKIAGQLGPQDLPILLFGNMISFVVGFLAIRGFVSFVSKHGLGVFGIYRIIVGVLILGAPYFGFELNLL
jgi:undecaprenyl-diphosphatase